MWHWYLFSANWRRIYSPCLLQIALSNPPKKLNRDILDSLDKSKTPSYGGFPLANPHSITSVYLRALSQILTIFWFYYIFVKQISAAKDLLDRFVVKLYLRILSSVLMPYEVPAKWDILAGIRLVEGKLFNDSADSFNYFWNLCAYPSLHRKER